MLYSIFLFSSTQSVSTRCPGESKTCLLSVMTKYHICCPSNPKMSSQQPFTVSPDEAYKKFESWAVNEQGLGPLISVGGPIGSATVLPMYAPFWYFKLNVRFGGGTLIPVSEYEYSYS